MDYLPLTLVGILSPDAVTFAEVTRIADIAGIDVVVVHRHDELSRCVLQLMPAGGSDSMLTALFHEAYAPYFAVSPQVLSPAIHTEELLEMMLAAGSTKRGRVIGVMGAHGGAGASTLAAWLARVIAQKQDVSLIDLDPYSAGIEVGLGLERVAGLRWADIADQEGSLVPPRLSRALPHLGSLRVLSADARGGAPREEKSAERAISALAQISDTCVLDLPRQAATPGEYAHAWLRWCDAVVIVSEGHTSGVRSLRMMYSAIAEHQPVCVVRGVKSLGHLAAISSEIGVQRIERFRISKTLALDLEHGMRIGDRDRCVTAADVASIMRRCQEVPA